MVSGSDANFTGYYSKTTRDKPRDQRCPKGAVNPNFLNLTKYRKK